MPATVGWRHAAWTLRRLLIAYCAYWGLNWINADVLSAYIRTLIRCNALSDGPGRESALWSGSEYCTDKEFVLLQQTHISGDLATLSTVTQCVAVPILGAVADLYGRKRIIVVGVASWVLFGLFLVLSTSWAAAAEEKEKPAWSLLLQQPVLWLYIGTLLSASMNGFDPAAFSMAADMSGDSVEVRGTHMSVLIACKTAVICVAFSLGYVVLSWNLTDYTGVWAVFTVCSCGLLALVHCTLKESFSGTANAAAGEGRGSSRLPSLTTASARVLSDDGPSSEDKHTDGRAGAGAGGRGSGGVRGLGLGALCERIGAELGAGLMLLIADRFLLGFLSLLVLNLMAIFGSILLVNPFLLGTFHYTQAAASVAGIAQQPAVLLGVLLCKRLMMQQRGGVGPYRVQKAGLALCAGGHALMAFAPTLLPSHAHAAAGGTGMGMGGMGMGGGAQSAPTPSPTLSPTFGPTFVDTSVGSSLLAQAVWWAGFLATGVSFGLLDPSRTTIVSMRVREELQGKLQGVMMLCYLAGQALGYSAWARLLYAYTYTPARADAEGSHSSGRAHVHAGFAASSLCMAASALLYHALLRCTATSTSRGGLQPSQAQASQARGEPARKAQVLQLARMDRGHGHGHAGGIQPVWEELFPDSNRRASTSSRASL